MRLYSIQGNLVKKNVTKYAIDWDKKSRSIIQFQNKQFLRYYWGNHVVFEEFPVYGSLLKVDILNATLKIAVEVNGPQHGEFHYFHNNSPFSYLTGIKNDMKKAQWLDKNGYKLVEINHDEIFKLSPEFFKEKFDVTL